MHHGVNPQYIDKNYSEFLIIWDKLFGSYAEDEEEVRYGVTHPPSTWDPLDVNFQFWRQLFSDAWHTSNWFDKLRIWFMPTGWRPADVRDEVVPERIGYGLSEQVKFTSEPYPNMTGYLIAQVMLGMGYMYVAINMEWPLSALDRVIMSLGLFLMITSWGGILQARKLALPLEIFRTVYMASTLVFVLNKNAILPWTSWLTIFAALASGVGVLHFVFQVRRAALAAT